MICTHYYTTQNWCRNNIYSERGGKFKIDLQKLHYKHLKCYDSFNVTCHFVLISQLNEIASNIKLIIQFLNRKNKTVFSCKT